MRLKSGSKRWNIIAWTLCSMTNKKDTVETIIDTVHGVCASQRILDDDNRVQGCTEAAVNIKKTINTYL